MDTDEWVNGAARIHASQQVPRAPQLSDRLVPDTEYVFLAAIDRHIRKAPHTLLAKVRNDDECFLSSASLTQIDRLTEGSFRWALPKEPTAEDWLRAAMYQVRALDEMLARNLLDGRRVRSDSRHWFIEQHGVYIVPRSGRRLDGSKPKTGEPYSRRGVIFHSILPKQVAGLTLRIVQLPRRSGFGGVREQGLTLGAALFKNGKLRISMLPGTKEKPRRFVASEFDCPSAETQLVGQIAAAFEQSCFAAVWPELTIPPDSRAVLTKELAGCALHLGAHSPLQVVVGGSWHVSVGKNVDGETTWVNEAPIYNRYGRLVLTYNKVEPYFDAGGVGEEAIESGNEIAVVVADDIVVAFGICKDFCDRADTHPLRTLPVDLILIPSMGEEQALAGHISNAGQVRLSTGASVFIVQQCIDADCRCDGGYVVRNTLGGVQTGERQADQWKTYQPLPD